MPLPSHCRTSRATGSFVSALLLTLLAAPAPAADSDDNPRLRRELIGTTSGLTAATAGGFIPGPVGSAFEVSALALDLTTKSLAPEFHIPPDFSVSPNVSSDSSIGLARCDFRFEDAVSSGENQDGDDGLNNGILGEASRFMFIPVAPLQDVWGSLNRINPATPRVYHPNADVNVKVFNQYLGGVSTELPRFPIGRHSLSWSAETKMNIPIDVAFGTASVVIGNAGEFREFRKAKMASVSKAFQKGGVREFKRQFAELLVDLFEVIKFAVTNTGGVAFNPNNPEAWYDATNIITASNNNTQVMTVWDINTPYILDSDNLPANFNSRSLAITEQSSTIEATDFGGVRFRRAKRALQKRFAPIDECSQRFTVTTATPDTDILPIGVSTPVEWTIEELGGPYSQAMITGGLITLSPNQTLVGDRIVTTFTQNVTVEDTQAPLLLAPPGFARYANANVVLANENPDYLGRPRVVDLADANPQVTTIAPAVLNLDERTSITWQASDVSGNSSDVLTQLVTLKSPGTNNPPTAYPTSAATLPFINPETGSADISRKVDITLTGADPDILDNVPDPLDFRIASFPDGGEFEAPLLPFFINDYRVTPNGETVDNEGTYARTSPLGDLAEGFYIADKTGHSAFLTANVCNAAPGTYGADVLNNTIPVDFIYQPSAIFVDDEGFTYIQDYFWVCGENLKTNSPLWAQGLGQLSPILRISKWAEDGSLVAMRALTGVDDPGYAEVVPISNEYAGWFGNIDRQGRLWIQYDPVYTDLNNFSFRFFSIDRDLNDIQSHGGDSWALLGINAKEWPFQSFASDPEQGLLYVVHREHLAVRQVEANIQLSDLNANVIGEVDLSSIATDALSNWGGTSLTDSEGNLYVVDKNHDRVHKIAATTKDQNGEWVIGEYIGWMGSCTTNKSVNNVPYSACDEDTGVSLGFACTDQKCNRAADPAGSNPGQFDDLRRMEIDPNDIIYVADYGNSRVQRFGTDGTLAGIANSTGTGINQGEEPGFMLGNFGKPDFISVNSDSLFILTRDDINSDYFAHSFKTLPFFEMTDNAACPAGAPPGVTQCSSAKVRYVAKFDFDGTDNFSFLVDDGIDRSAPATVDVNAAYVNRNPEKLRAECYADAALTAQQPCTLNEDSQLYIRLVASDKDGFVSVDGRDKLLFQITRTTVNGDLEFVSKQNNSALYLYTPLLNFHGSDSLAFEVRDNKGAYAGSYDLNENFVRDEVELDLTINPVPDPVVIELDEVGKVARGFRTVFTGRFSDADMDHQPDLQYMYFRELYETSPPFWVDSGRTDLNGRQESPQIDLGLGTGLLAYSHVYTESGDYTTEIFMGNQETLAEPLTPTRQIQNVEVIDATVVTADVSSARQVDPDVVFPLDITVTNLVPEAGWAGAVATGTELKISVPTGMQLLSIDGACVQNVTIDCALGDLNPGDQATVSFTAQIPYAEALEKSAFDLELETIDGGPKITDRNVILSGISIADADEDGVFDVDDAFPNDAHWFADSDGDGLADSWELEFGLDPDVFDNPATDVDGDGRDLQQEFADNGFPFLNDIETLQRSAPLTPAAPIGEDRYGQALTGADFNLDGYADTVIGAPNHNATGKVYVAYGSAGDAENGNEENDAPGWVQELNPAAGDTAFGQSVAAGDWDNNGYPDIAITFDDGVAIHYNNGQLYDIADDTLVAPGGATVFGNFLHSGDVDNDGIEDLIVPYLQSGTATYLRIYRSSGGELASQTPLQFAVAAGTAVNSIATGDIDGDSLPDILVGLSGAQTVVGYLGAENDWANVAGVDVNASFDLSRADGNFGFSIASGADIGGDGIDDLVVGAYSNAGRIVVYDSATDYWDVASPGDTSSVDPTQIIDGLDDGSTPGDARGDQFGVRVAMGHLDSDAHADVVVGANRTAVNDLGQTYVFRGSAAGLQTGPQIEDGDSASSHFGYYVAIPGDTDGDGYDDVASGAPKISAGEAGYAVLLRHQFTAANPADDPDGDGVGVAFDNCPAVANTDLANYDNDAFGDACDADIDGDGLANEVDNCPVNDDPSQTDTDMDGEGDVCDTDDDNDGIPDDDDAFPLLQSEWQDGDNDGIGDNSDPCLDVPNGERTPWRDVTTLDNTASGTANGSEIAAIGGCSATGLPTITMFDAVTGDHLRNVNVTGAPLSNWAPLAVDRVLDTNGDGTEDDQSLALFFLNHNRNAYFARLIDPVTGSPLRADIRLFSNADDWIAYDLAVLNDSNGDGVSDDPAVAVLAYKVSTGRNTLLVKRLSDGQTLGNWNAFNERWTPRRLTTTVLDGQPIVAILADHALATSVEYRNVLNGTRWRTPMFNFATRGNDLAIVDDADGNGTADDPGIAVIGEKLDTFGKVTGNRLIVRRISDGANTRSLFMSTGAWQTRHIEIIRDTNGNGVKDVVGLLEKVGELELLSPTGPDYRLRTRDQDTAEKLYDEKLD